MRATAVGYDLPGGRRLFRDVSLTVGAGEAVAIEGPSGSGKTTLLAILGGLITPTLGTVETGAGRVRACGWVLQSLNALGARTVLHNVCVSNLLDGEPAAEVRARARDALQTLGMGHIEAERARTLSGGELQRMAVARAIVSEQPLILADEPSNQLDRANAQVVMRALVGCAARGSSVVIVTHDRDALPPGTRTYRLTEEGLRGAA